MPYYGVYDFTNAENMHEMMLPFLEQFVMKARYTDDPEQFKAASPISYVHSEAPPFFVLHGEKDELVPCRQARAFCAALRGSRSRDGVLRRTRQCAPRLRHHPDGPLADWPPTPSPTSWASSTGGARARGWVRCRCRRRRPADTTEVCELPPSRCARTVPFTSASTRLALGWQFVNTGGLISGDRVGASSYP